MSQPCWSCLRGVVGEGRYHPQCLLRLFGTERVPRIDVKLAKLHTLALAMVGHVSLSGVQRKISLWLDGGFYILKPQAQAFPSLPENEHVTMLMAEQWGLEVPPLALIELADGSVAYLVQRFDRRREGGKRRQEDFCQLAGLSPKEKYGRLPPKAAERVLSTAATVLPECLELIRRSALPEDMRARYAELLRERTAVLGV